MKFKRFVGKSVVEVEGVPLFYLELSILESIVEFDNESTATYGIQIEKSGFEGTRVLESGQVDDITTCEAEIKKLARILFDGEVEPHTLPEVIFDYVDSPEYLAG